MTAEREFERVRGGVRIEAEVSTLIDLSELFDPKITDLSGDPRLRHLLVFAMYQLFYYEARIDLAYPGENYATKHGGEILTALECTTADEFFALARKLYDDPDQWPEYFDTANHDYIDHHDFVTRSCYEQDESG